MLGFTLALHGQICSDFGDPLMVNFPVYVMQLQFLLAQTFSDKPTFTGGDTFGAMPWWLKSGLILVAIRLVVAAINAIPQNRGRKARASDSPASSGLPMASQQATLGAPAGLLLGGYICAVVSLLLLPPFLGLAGVGCGVLAMKQGQRNQGRVLIIIACICAVGGMIYGAASR